MEKDTFGQLLRKHRRRCDDPMRGGFLTQERLGELVGDTLGGMGYSGAAVSDWERDRSVIHKDDRRLLLSLIQVLYNCSGINLPQEANALLNAGNYRSLSDAEVAIVLGPQLQPNHQPEAESQSVYEAAPSLPGDRKLSKTRKKQEILLDKVAKFWIRSVMESATREGKLLDLERRWFGPAVAHPWINVTSPTVHQVKDGAAAGTIYDNYLAAHRALLILGAPGSGKTILMLRLVRELIARAREDPGHPIPVVLNLASWNRKSAALDRWVVEELTARYQIPRRMAQKWQERDQLTLFLDGFDEVPPVHRPACAAVINQFRDEFGLTGIVICSRLEDFQVSGAPLKMGGAITIQPLDREQIDDYCEDAGDRLASLRVALAKDPVLLEMASTPLMLSVMTVAYRDLHQVVLENDSQGKAGALMAEEAGQAPVRRSRLFDAYVNRMLAAPGREEKYTRTLVCRKLGWLAQQMIAHHRGVFMIEELQPSWLPARRWRWIYQLINGFVNGLVTGLLLWLFLRRLHITMPEFSRRLFERLVSSGLIQPDTTEWLVVFGLNIFLGLLVALMSGYFMERTHTVDILPQSRKWKRILIQGLVVFAVTVAALWPAGALLPAMVWAAAEAVVFMTIARHLYGLNFETDIRAVEALSWSWPQAVQGLLIGILLGAISLAYTMTLVQSYTPRTVYIFGLGAFILGGLRGRQIEKTSIPNQGILLSLRNSVFAAVPTALLTGLLAQYLYGGSAGLSVSLILGLITFSLFGGSILVKHILIRGMLHLLGVFPWRSARFLDYCARLIFLRKVGGGYIFTHRLLQDYFAAFAATSDIGHRSRQATTHAAGVLVEGSQ